MLVSVGPCTRREGLCLSQLDLVHGERACACLSWTLYMDRGLVLVSVGPCTWREGLCLSQLDLVHG